MRKQIFNSVKAGLMSNVPTNIHKIYSLPPDHQYRQVLMDLDKMYLPYGLFNAIFGTVDDPLDPNFDLVDVKKKNFAGYEVSILLDKM
jgi:hypothetical protein